MGNCLRHESPMMWGGDDWGTDLRQYGEITEKGIIEIEEKGLLTRHEGQKNHVTTSSTSYSKSATTYANYGNTTSSSTSTNNTSTEVKIKISKKQLEGLLGKVDVKDLSVQQVLAQLINVSESNEAQHLRSWRPALQSIPEVN